MKAKLTLAKLNPLCQFVVLLVYIISEFSNIVKTLRIVCRRGLCRKLIDLMTDAVNEWQNAHCHRYLGTLLQVSALITLYTQTSLSHFLLLLFQKIVKLSIFFLLMIHAVKKPQEEDE